MSMMQPQPTYRPRHGTPKDRAKSRRRRRLRPGDGICILFVGFLLTAAIVHSNEITELLAIISVLVSTVYFGLEMRPKGTRAKTETHLPTEELEFSAPVVEPKLLEMFDRAQATSANQTYGPEYYDQQVYPEVTRPQRKLFWGLVATYGALSLLDHHSKCRLEESQQMNREIEAQFFEGMKHPPWTNS